VYAQVADLQASKCRLNIIFLFTDFTLAHIPFSSNSDSGSYTGVSSFRDNSSLLESASASGERKHDHLYQAKMVLKEGWWHGIGRG
jgi:hypothetical protein